MLYSVPTLVMPLWIICSAGILKFLISQDYLFWSSLISTLCGIQDVEEIYKNKEYVPLALSADCWISLHSLKGTVKILLVVPVPVPVPDDPTFISWLLTNCKSHLLDLWKWCEKKEKENKYEILVVIQTLHYERTFPHQLIIG